MRSLVLVAALAACTSPMEELEPQVSTAVDLWVAMLPPQPRDVLIVIERSAAVEPYEAILAERLRGIGNQLAWWGDTHVGVVGSDAETLVNGYLVDHVDLLRVRTTNYAGTLGDALAQRGALGHASTATSRPLEVATVALREPANTGFRRRTVPLVVVILAATDDASTAPVADLAKAIEDAPARIGDAFVVIGARRPAPRLESVPAAMPNRAAIASLDSPDVEAFVGSFAPRWPLFGQTCFERPLLDEDPANCTVTQETADHTPELVLPACDPASTNMPCWMLRPDPQDCPFLEAGNLSLEARYRDRLPELHYVHAQCATARP